MAGFGQGAAEGLEQVLARLFLQQKLREDQRQADMQHAVQQRQLGQGDRRIDLEGDRLAQDAAQFDVTSGQNQQRINLDKEFQPVRIKRAQAETAEIERKPLAESEARAHDQFMAGLQGKIRSGHIREQGDQDVRVSNARPQAGLAGGWQLKEITNPQTNQVQLVRVNDVTGEMQVVQLPEGFQPGGNRQKSLSVSQQEDLATMKTIQDMAVEVRRLGEQTGGKGIGGLGAGTVGQLKMRHLGQGDASQEQLRNFIGNIQGTIAKLRGGTAFTAQEKAMLDNYTPTINESWPSVTAKLASLDKFIESKRSNMLQFAGANPGSVGGAGNGGSGAAARAAELLKKYGGQ